MALLFFNVYQKWKDEILTQFGNDFLDADLAPVHQVSDPVQALTEWLLCFFEAGHKMQVTIIKERKRGGGGGRENFGAATPTFWHRCVTFRRFPRLPSL